MKEEYSDDVMDWACKKCQKEGILTIPGMDADRAYYVVCKDCGEELRWCDALAEIETLRGGIAALEDEVKRLRARTEADALMDRMADALRQLDAVVPSAEAGAALRDWARMRGASTEVGK